MRFDPADYLGFQVTRDFEVVAKNLNATQSYAVNLLDSSGTPFSSVTLPPLTTVPTRFHAVIS